MSCASSAHHIHRTNVNDECSNAARRRARTRARFARFGRRGVILISGWRDEDGMPGNWEPKVARKKTRFSLEEIGGYFGGRDHTTVMHSVKTIEERISQDQDVARQIEKIETLMVCS